MILRPALPSSLQSTSMCASVQVHIHSSTQSHVGTCPFLSLSLCTWVTPYSLLSSQIGESSVAVSPHTGQPSTVARTLATSMDRGTWAISQPSLWITHRFAGACLPSQSCSVFLFCLPRVPVNTTSVTIKRHSWNLVWPTEQLISGCFSSSGLLQMQSPNESSGRWTPAPHRGLLVLSAFWGVNRSLRALYPPLFFSASQKMKRQYQHWKGRARTFMCIDCTVLSQAHFKMSLYFLSSHVCSVARPLVPHGFSVHDTF